MLDTLEERIYHIVLDVAVFISVITVVANLFLRVPGPAVLSSAMVLVFVILLQFVTIRYPRYSRICRIILVLGLNLVLFPGIFFASGGIYSGTILFYLLGVAMCATLLRGNFGGVVFLLSVLMMELSITVSTLFPNLVQVITPAQHRQSMKVTLLLSAMALYSIVLLILRSYNKERTQNEALMQKLRELSTRDTLSGLYNRRELFRRLEIMYGAAPQPRTETLTRTGHYIAMFDVDDFKKLNDSYGHSFGDRVLVDVSRVLNEKVRPEAGELSARYGGEEFVSVLAAVDTEEAFSRVDHAREAIATLSWEEHPDVRVSISGGLLSCADHPDLTQAMHDVDVLLYKAKAANKNRICVAETA